jgi:chromosome partitioning protein
MIIAITNSKGGVGKTTTAVNLATSLATRGKPTLIVDLDPQAHATQCLLEGEHERNISEFIMERPSQAARAISKSTIPNLDIVPSGQDLTQTAELLSTRIRREERLRRALECVSENYQHIILDCPPVLSILAYNALIAADLLVIPVQPGVGAVVGLDALLDATRELRDEEDVAYRILITMFDIRTTRTNAIVDELLDENRKRMLKTVISKSEALNQANLASKPVQVFAPSSRGRHEYDALCDEILRLRSR